MWYTLITNRVMNSSNLPKIFFAIILLVVIFLVGFFVYDQLFVLDEKNNESTSQRGREKVILSEDLSIDASQEAVKSAVVLYQLSGRIHDLRKEGESYKFTIQSHTGVPMFEEMEINEENLLNLVSYDPRTQETRSITIEQLRVNDSVEADVSQFLKGDTGPDITVTQLRRIEE